MYAHETVLKRNSVNYRPMDLLDPLRSGPDSDGEQQEHKWKWRPHHLVREQQDREGRTRHWSWRTESGFDGFDGRNIGYIVHDFGEIKELFCGTACGELLD